MSDASPSPEDEIAPQPKDEEPTGTSTTKPEDVDLVDGTDESGIPVDNPAG